MVAPAPAIASCTGGDFDALLTLLDQEFIFGRGRRLSLKQRFPATLRPQHPENILLARMEDAVVSALAVKPFTWITPERRWHAAMIGLVYTRPDWRGRGTASALMRAAQAKLEQEGFDFAVLWTRQPGFYARLGWIGADCGMLGSVQAATPGVTPPQAAPDAADIAWIETLRPDYAPERAERSDMNYAAVMPPAERLELLRGDSAYAIVGCGDGHGYLYDMLGGAGELPALWATLAARYRTLWLNLQRGSAAERFLSARSGINWQPQQLAMWLPLAAAARGARFADWYVPFLDRI